MSCYNLSYESLDALYSALATLPALESVWFHALKVRQADESALTNPESLTELLRVPSLRSVCFNSFYLTTALSRAIANALMEGTAVAKLEFWDCRFSAEECAVVMENGLSRNTSVTCIDVVSPCDGTLHSALARALLSNSTLRHLSFHGGTSRAEDLPPVLLALGMNKGLKILKVDAPDSMEESLCTALKDGLGMNETLDSLQLNCIPMCDDKTDLWCRAFSFLRTNKTLNSLVLGVKCGVTETCLSAFLIDIAAMLQQNASLESLAVHTFNGIQSKADKYLVLVTALQNNKTLKTLSMYHNRCLTLTDDEDKQMAALLKKNYAMKSLPDIDLVNEAGDVSAILRLNEAGRRYLIEDGSSISKGVEVLSSLNDEINCVFLHLLENPRLCDRSAVEVASDNSAERIESANPANRNGKREQCQSVNEGKESRRRRA